MSAELYFTSVSSFFLSFFRRIISKVAERNSTTKIGHMVGSECNLKTRVRNLGYPPYKSGAPKPPFWTTSQLNGNFNGLYLRNETWHRQSVKCVDNRRGLLHHPKMSWTLVHKRLQTRPAFYPPSVNSAFCFIARLLRRSSAAELNQTLPSNG